MTGSRSRSSPLGELEPDARRRVRVGALIAALATAAMVWVAGPRLARPLYDLWQNVLPAPPPSAQVHVVVIDADSLKSVGGWPWSRYYLARLVDEIAKRGAVAIGLDLLMPEPDRLDPPRFAGLYPELTPAAAAEVKALPSMDAVLARTIGQHPVVLARAGALRRSFDAVDQAAAPLPPEAQFVGPVPGTVRSYPQAVTNLPILDGAPLGHGLVNGDPDDDGVVRRVPLVARVAGAPTPGFALELVRIARNAERIDLKGVDGSLSAVRVGDRQVPASSEGQLALRFGDWRAVRTTSAANLLRQGLPDDLFKGQIVLVGLTSAGTSDVVTTPRARETFGVYVQAQAVASILRGEGLARPPWAAWAEWGAAALMALGSWWAVTRLPILGAAVLGVVGLATGLGASALAFTADLLIDPFPALAPALATAAAAVAGLFVEGRAVQARLRESLEQERLQAARVAGELAAAAEIQSGMLLPRAELAGLTPAAEVDAFLRPARSVGGDLYDAFMLDDRRLCFLVGDVTGKGVPAALFMALGKSLARSLLSREADLAAAVRRINTELSQDNRQDMALTLLVGVLRLDDGRLDLVCAGHENPLVTSASGDVRELALRGGLPLCVAPDFPYEVEAEQLALGETLLGFSDGFTEAQSAEGALWPRVDLLAAVEHAAGAASLTDMVDDLVAAVRTFENGADPADDLTLIAVRRPGG